jgi:pimeloyl-ACP methyl ester carboxylesterase
MREPTPNYNGDEKPLKQRLHKLFAAVKKSAQTGVGILNGVVGDYLHEQQNALAVQMQFYLRNRALELTPAMLRQAYPVITPKVCILVHGLTHDERTWAYRDDPETNYGSLLQRELGYTPFYLRYNTGLRISENGKQFSRIITDLLAAYPVNLKEIVLITHSMGGLVARSACYYGAQHQADWVNKVQKLFYLGSPHLGAPLEKFGNVVSNVLHAVPRPYTKLAGDVINLRSSGIKDLRFGNVVEEDWAGRHPDALLRNGKNPIPLLAGASHYVITGTLMEDPNHFLAHWFGDTMVRKPSARGHSKRARHHLPFPPEHHKEFPKMGHLKLTRDPRVYQQIKHWCQETRTYDE